MEEAFAVWGGVTWRCARGSICFLNQVRLRRGIPFDIEIPNAESQKIFHEIRKGKNIEEFSTDELKRG